MIPGVAQPVFRAVTLQPGQLLPGQLSGQHLSIQNLPEQQAQALQAAIRHGKDYSSNARKTKSRNKLFLKVIDFRFL